MEKYIYSHLAIENFDFEVSKKKDMLSSDAKESYFESCENGIKISRITADADKAQGYRRTYLTLSYDKEKICDTALSDCVASQLRSCLDIKLKTPLRYESKILVVGLGNLDMTADSIGPRTVKKISVTGHVSEYGARALKRLGRCRIFALSAGVMGETGIESAQIVKAVSRECGADAIIAVDSLAARDAERLVRTVQISDNGISPGSGIYNARKEISERTMGVPVIAVGVPTVIEGATLVSEMLRGAGIEKADKNIELALESQRGFFVTPKDVDLSVRLISSMLADSIDKALEIKEYNHISPNIL